MSNTSVAPYRTLAQLSGDQSGVAIVEFAYMLPVLLLIYLGSFELCNALSIQRQVTTTARTIVDVTSRNEKVTNDDLDKILQASVQTMTPYSTRLLTATVSEISVDDAGKPTVTWSRGYQTKPLLTGKQYALTDALRIPNTSVIVSNVTYNYAPVISKNIFGNIPLSDSIIMNPRKSNDVQLILPIINAF